VCRGLEWNELNTEGRREVARLYAAQQPRFATQTYDVTSGVSAQRGSGKDKPNVTLHFPALLQCNPTQHDKPALLPNKISLHK
jgi:hypothetical protein